MAKQEDGPLKHLLPPLPYEHAALEPHIDAHTMMLHHDKHRASYVANLNSALEKFPELQERAASWLLLNLSKVPEKIRAAARHKAGGHYLKHENRRADYLNGWWSVVNWEEAARRFARSDHGAEDSWESEGGSLLKATA